MNTIDRYRLEEEEKWREIIKQIPYLPFKSEWEVAPIPPFSGAVARFLVRHKEYKETNVSVYLDWYEKLGFMEGPYWEVYPCDDDCNRHTVDDVKGLM